MLGKPDAVRLIREITSALPGIECKRLCGHDCKNIELSPVENDEIRRRKGVGIYPPEKLMKARSVDSLVVPLLGVRLFSGYEDATCPLYDRIRGICTCHELRPIICWLYGIIAPMQCPHGCQPERLLTYKEGYLIQARVNWLGGYLNDEEYERSQRWAEDPEIFPILEERACGRIRQKEAEAAIYAILERKKAEKGTP